MSAIWTTCACHVSSLSVILSLLLITKNDDITFDSKIIIVKKDNTITPKIDIKDECCVHACKAVCVCSNFLFDTSLPLPQFNIYEVKRTGGGKYVKTKIPTSKLKS